MVTAWGRCPTCERVHEPGACRLPRVPRELFGAARAAHAAAMAQPSALYAATEPRNAVAVTRNAPVVTRPAGAAAVVLPAGLVADLVVVVGEPALQAWVEATLRAAAKRHQAKARSNAERQRAHRERQAKAKNTGRAAPGASKRTARKG